MMKDIVKCRLCGLTWQPRKVLPRACPSCKSYQWNGVRGQTMPHAERTVPTAMMASKLVERVAEQPMQARRILTEDTLPSTLPMSVRLNFNTDVLKITKTPKAQLDIVIPMLTEAYPDYPDYVQAVVDKAMQNKKEFAGEQHEQEKSDLAKSPSGENNEMRRL